MSRTNRVSTRAHTVPISDEEMDVLLLFGREHRASLHLPKRRESEGVGLPQHHGNAAVRASAGGDEHVAVLQKEEIEERAEDHVRGLRRAVPDTVSSVSAVDVGEREEGHIAGGEIAYGTDCMILVGAHEEIHSRIV